jgi:phosphoglycolate phosphatase
MYNEGLYYIDFEDNVADGCCKKFLLPTCSYIEPQDLNRGPLGVRQNFKTQNGADPNIDPLHFFGGDNQSITEVILILLIPYVKYEFKILSSPIYCFYSPQGLYFQTLAGMFCAGLSEDRRRALPQIPNIRLEGFKMIEAVLFDLDGTLLNSLDDLADSGNYVMSLNGWPVHETNAYKYFVGDGVVNLVTRIMPEKARTPDEIERVRKVFVEYYQAHAVDKTRPYDGITGTLDAVAKAGVKMAVVSNKPDAQTQYTVAQFFGPDRFDFAVGNRTGLQLKPAPDIANLVLETLAVSPDRTLFVGDTGVDMKTAKNAHCSAVGVTWGFRTEKELRENGADFIISSPEELVGLL